MIGDDIVNDVGGAQRCGMRGVQVRTGKYRSVPPCTPHSLWTSMEIGEITIDNDFFIYLSAKHAAF